ncbi:MAG: sugar ABC transporter permease [Huintestinicola sp.]|uniref:sugar ABC transporter permease n=1 Tax=Huintestinicola sp. TaxID=2981661 RepID=UPI003F111CCD
MFDLNKSYKAQQKFTNGFIQILLLVLGIIWILPLCWVILTSFREEPGSYTSYFWPKGFTVNNYVNLITKDQQFHFTKWFANTLLVSVISCIGSTLIVLAVSFALSRLRFKMRKPLMNVALILGMFPGFMSMIAVYYILKGMNLLNEPLVCLTLVYIAGSGLQYYIAKGFFDTVPKALDESAYLDGATKSQVFFKITLPLSKPIIVYTILTSFMAPWIDYIFPSIICGSNYESYTVALGMFKMLEREFIGAYYTQFAAGAVLVSIPIAALFISMQKYYVEGVTGGAVKG